MDLVARTRELLDVWNEGGPDELGVFAQDDVVLVEREDVLERDTIFGKQAVIDRFRDRLTLVGPSKAAPRSVELLDAGRVLADMDLHFEGRVSGVEGDLQMVHVYTWDDGLLARIEEFPDTASARGLDGRLAAGRMDGRRLPSTGERCGRAPDLFARRVHGRVSFSFRWFLRCACVLRCVGIAG